MTDEELNTKICDALDGDIWDPKALHVSDISARCLLDALSTRGVYVAIDRAPGHQYTVMMSDQEQQVVEHDDELAYAVRAAAARILKVTS